MRFSKNLKVRAVALLLMVAILVTFVHPIQANATGNAKIHYITLNHNTLSVLVECNGKFGMIDSGEDTDYPDGSDPRYPDRAHITKGVGYEDDVIAYLKSVGVTKDNFVFYIGTHPHSDHIGSADEVIRAFAPKQVYMQEYKDSYISDTTKLWDNLYVYDNLIAAANAVGAELIQDINNSNAVFTLGGDMKISIKNYGTDYKTTPTNDANDFSLGVLVEANGKSVFVGGDINNFAGDEDALLKELGHVDVLTLGHHGCYGSNSYKYVTGLTPKMMILAGDYAGVSNTGLPNDKSVYDTLMEMGKKGVPLYVTGLYSGELGAIVIHFDSTLSTNIPANSVKVAKASGVYPRVNITYKNGIPVQVICQGEWISDGDRWWYRHGDGSYTTSDWEEINGEWYYFDAEGWMATGWIKLNGVWYYLEEQKGDDEGKMRTGWLEDGGVWYYLDPESGAMVTGWQTIDGKQYHFNPESGAMVVNAVVDGKYLNAQGVVCKNEWITEGGRKWYCHADGSYTTNDWEQIGGKWYFFDAEGWMATGWIQWKNVWYYLNPGDGVMVTGMKTIAGKTYYFNSEGAMLTGLQTVGGKTYYFNGDGAMQTGWHTIGGKTYYFGSDGAMLKNTTVDGKKLGSDGAYIPVNEWITEGGRKWYRHADGSYTTNNWEKIDGKWYFFDAEGWMATGWIQWKNVWYYLNPSNGVMVTGWKTINGQTYYFNGDGAMQTGWVQLSGKWYYLDASGARVTGWLDLGGTWYYLYPSTGVMAANTWVDGCYVNADGVWIP